MRERILARRYSKALLDLGVEEKVLERIREEMARLTETFNQEPILLKYLFLKEVKLEKKKSILEGLNKALLLSPWIQTFLDLLIRRRRIALFPTIALVFEELIREMENIVVAKLKVADKKSVEGLKDSLKQALEKLTGKKVELEIEERPKLIGGLQVCIGDTIYDASLAGELERIKEEWLS